MIMIAGSRRPPSPRSAAGSYREDIAGRTVSDADGADHGGWIMIATIVHHAAMMPGEDGDRMVGQAVSLATEMLGAEAVERGCALDPPSAVGSDPEIDVLRLIAERIEDGGLLNLAHGVLENLEAACTLSELERWRVVAHRARLDWKMGNLDTAKERYATIEQVGIRSQNAELKVRAWIGFGTLAQVRGNYPEVRKWATQALDLANANGFTRLGAVARHGMMVSAAVAKEFDEALLHGWELFRSSKGDQTAEAEALLQLGQLLLEIGHANEAQAAFSAALARTPPARLALPAGGGRAVATARLGDADIVRVLVADVAGAARSSGASYPAAAALWECAVALAMIGDHERASTVRQESLVIAKANEYHEIVFRAEHDGESDRRRKVLQVRRLGREAEAVAQEIVKLDPGELRPMSFAGGPA